MISRRPHSRLGLAFAAVLAAAFAPDFNGWHAAQAQATPISTQPIFISKPSSDKVRPNVLMVLDDSGSMDWTHMPDDVDQFARNGASGTRKFGYVSSQCNGVYYNPLITYTPPVDSKGSSLGNSSFTAAKDDGFSATTTTVDLSTNFQAWVGIQNRTANPNINLADDDTGQAAYYYIYKKPATNPDTLAGLPVGKGTQLTDKQKDYTKTTGVFFQECNSTIDSSTAVDGVTPVNQIFQKVVVSATSGPKGIDERTNFANWYTYYRKRMLMMKSATGRAFSALDDNYRVGYMTLNDNNYSAGYTDKWGVYHPPVPADFVNIGNFDQTQKDLFYTRLYAASPKNSTPLRAALATAGKIYAGKIAKYDGKATVTDPVQYSCQQNYTILSTDGFWNESDSLVTQVDGTTQMGNQDGTLPRPFFDGATVTITNTDSRTLSQPYQVTNTTTTTKTWTTRSASIGAVCNSSQPSSGVSSSIIQVGSTGSGTGNKYYAGVRLSTTNPSSGTSLVCSQLDHSDAWFCRGAKGATNPSGTSASVTDMFGRVWKLNTSVPSTTDCVKASTAFGSLANTTGAGVCNSVNGKTTTIAERTQTETVGTTSTEVDTWQATQSATQTIVNGVAGSWSAFDPSNPTLGPTTPPTVVSGPTSVPFDTCGGVAGPPCPSATGTWTPAGSSYSVCATVSSVAALSTPTLTATSTNTTQNSSAVVGSPVTTTDVMSTKTDLTGGTSDTLADVAAYYYYTNLRTTALGNCTGPIIAPATTPTDLCKANAVPGTADDPATWQHMTTFTVGLGTRGKMVYSPNYKTDPTAKPPVAGDYTDVYFGNIASSTNCTWISANSPCNWPIPGADKPENADDLWHAAVNGHGTYYSATDPTKVSDGLTKTLQYIVNQPKPGTAASAATTNPKVTENSNFQFSSYFLSVEWSGDLIRQTKDLATGKPPVFDLQKRVAGTFDWSARDQLDATTYSSRKIYTANAASTALIPFTWSDLSNAGLTADFLVSHIRDNPPQYPAVLTGLSQFCATGTTCISSTVQSDSGGAAGEALVNFLRGDRSNEEVGTPDNTKFYRQRTHVLGDIVSAQPQYSGAPKWSYADTGYAAFKAANLNRQGLVFAAANDGMLHAFDAGTGAEVWAYVPSYVRPRMYTLADKNYSAKHQYFVEGTPTVADICANPCTGASDWKTILVGGLNGGGTGYYALDITTPTSPQLLWEFTDTAASNMGYTFGNPQIAKLDNNTWVVMFTSGYDNCPNSATPSATNPCTEQSPAGNGQGYLYVLEANKGAVLKTLSTAVGSAATPSGLGKIVAQVDASNVTQRVYGGDLQGNLWRFMVSPTNGWGVQLLATLVGADGKAQPIMDKPQVTTINTLPVVYVGTGRYLSASDVGLKPPPQNSFYAIKDKLGASGYGNPRTASNFIMMTAVDGLCPTGTDTSICNPGDPVRTLSQTAGKATDTLYNMDGWIVDFPSTAGEIQFTDPKLVLGTITFTTSIPSIVQSDDVCKASASPTEGTSFLYMLDYLSGRAIPGSNGVAGASLGDGIATSPQFSQLQDGSVIITTRMSGGNDVYSTGRFSAQGGSAKRVSWRELIMP
jgi:type IV pilus assembly protein PilY1